MGTTLNWGNAADIGHISNGRDNNINKSTACEHVIHCDGGPSARDAGHQPMYTAQAGEYEGKHPRSTDVNAFAGRYPGPIHSR